jgi:hypothetical protein
MNRGQCRQLGPLVRSLVFDSRISRRGTVGESPTGGFACAVCESGSEKNGSDRLNCHRQVGPPSLEAYPLFCSSAVKGTKLFLLFVAFASLLHRFHSRYPILFVAAGELLLPLPFPS